MNHEYTCVLVCCVCACVSRCPAWRWLSSITPLGYAFEALLINEFSDAEGIRPYVIEGSVSVYRIAIVPTRGRSANKK